MKYNIIRHRRTHQVTSILCSIVWNIKVYIIGDFLLKVSSQAIIYNSNCCHEGCAAILSCGALLKITVLQLTEI